MSRITTMSEAETALNGVNISIKDMGGNIRPVSDILEQLAGKWGNLSDEQRQNLGVTLAGRYQLSRFLALMNNFSIATDATSMALNSQGSSMREQAKFADSLQGRLNRLDTAWNKVVLSAGNAVVTDGFVAVVETLNDLATTSSWVIDKIGLLSGVFATAGIAVFALSTKFRTFTTALFTTTSGLSATNLATIGLTTGMSRLAIATIGAKVAFRGLLAATGVGLVLVGVGFAIEKLIGLYSNAKQKQEEFEQSQKKNIEALTSNKQQTDELIKSYTELSKQKESGQWDTEKEKEYLKIQQQLGDVYPNLIEGMDATGQYRIKSVEDIGKEVKATKELIDLKKEEVRLNALQTFEDTVDDREGFLGLEKKIEAKRKQLKGMANHDFKQTFVNQVKQELLQLENELAQSALKVNDEVLNVAEAYNKLEIDPTISKDIQDFLYSLDLTDLNPTELEAYAISVGMFSDKMQKAYDSGDQKGFDNARDSLLSYAKQMGATDVQASELDISFEKVKEEAERLANATYAGADGMGAVETAMDGAGSSADRLVKSYDDAISNIESLNSILNDLNENHSVSSDTISTMMEKYPELLAYIDDEATLRRKISALIEEEEKTAKQAMMDKLSYSQVFYKKLISANSEHFKKLTEHYGIDLKNFNTLAELKLEVERTLTEKLKNEWKNYYSESEVITKAGHEMLRKASEAGKGTAEWEEAMEFLDALAVAQGRVKEVGLHEDLDKLANVEFDDSYGETFENLADNMKDTNEEIKDSIFLIDKHEQAIKDLNREINKQQNIQEQLVRGSEKWQKAIKEEINLTREKRDELAKQRKELESLQSQGIVYQSGQVSPSSVSNGSSYTGQYADAINQVASKYGIDPNLIAAVIRQESGFKQTGANGKTLTSSAGALGLMQLMPSTAKELGVNPHDAYENIMGGAKYLAQQLNTFGGSIEKALAAYNAGAGNVKKYDGIPPFKETQNYVKNILASLSNGVSTSSSSGGNAASYYLDNFSYSDGFGARGGNHNGIDFNKKGTSGNQDSGTAIKALMDGVVRSVGYEKDGAGYYITLTHGDGSVTKYFHLLERPNLKVGQAVSANQQIGKMGDTGDSSASHLHLEYWKDGKAQDPLSVLKGMSQGGYGDYQQALYEQGQRIEDIGVQQQEELFNQQRLYEDMFTGILDNRQTSIDYLERAIQEQQNIVDQNPEGSKLRDQALNQINYFKDLIDNQLNEIQYLANQYSNSDMISEAGKQRFSIREDEARFERQGVSLEQAETNAQRAREKQGQLDGLIQQQENSVSQLNAQQDNLTFGSEEYAQSVQQEIKHITEKNRLLGRQAEELQTAIDSGKLTKITEEEFKQSLAEVNMELIANNQLLQDRNDILVDNKLEQFNRELDKTSKRISKNEAIMGIYGEGTEEYNDALRDTIKALEYKNAVYEKEEKFIKEQIELRKQQGKSYDDLTERLSDNTLAQLENLQAQTDRRNELADKIIETMKNAYEKEKEFALAAIDEEMEALDKRHEKKMEQYDEELDRINEVYNAKIESIDKQENEDDYNKQLSELQGSQSEIQSKIDATALDTSMEAQNKRKELEQELADVTEQIEELKHNRSIELRKNALQEEMEADQEAVENKKEAEQDKYDSSKARLEKEKRETEYHYNEILANERYWNEMRTDIINGETTKIQAKLNSFLDDFQDKNEDVVEGLGSSWQELQNLLDDIIESQKEIEEYEENDRGSKRDDDEDDRSDSKPSESSKSRYEEIIDEMKSNARKWEDAGSSEKKRLEAKNQKLGKEAGLIYEPSTGIWYQKNGIRAFHEGGIVGQKPNRLSELFNKVFNTKPNEQIVKSLKGELQIPPNNFANGLRNIQNLINSSIPNLNLTTSQSGGFGDIIINFNGDIKGTKNEAKNFSTDIINNLKNKGIIPKKY